MNFKKNYIVLVFILLALTKSIDVLSQEAKDELKPNNILPVKELIEEKNSAARKGFNSNAIENNVLNTNSQKHDTTLKTQSKQANKNSIIEKKVVNAKREKQSFAKNVKAAPGNDDLHTSVCLARSVNPNGTCLTGQTNIGASPDYYGGCVPSGDISTVWYTFTLTGSNNKISLTFNNSTLGGTVYTFLFTGPCASPHGVATVCDISTATFTYENLTAGEEYFLLVATSAANEGNFDICITQSIMPTGDRHGPEQDCAGALPLCSTPITFVGSYDGYGDVFEYSPSSCLRAGETNSMWYTFSPQNPGSFYFSISTIKDYDFALYNITSIGCDGIPSATPVRCNYSNDLAPTGLTSTTSTELPALSVNEFGLPTMNGISNMAAGDVYALVIGNYTGDNTGFTLTVGGSASIIDGTPPTLTTAVSSCTANTITVNVSERIKCISINQGDFILTNTTTGTDFTSAITSVSGNNCGSSGADMTTQINITHNGSLTTGVYRISINSNPMLEDVCGNIITAGEDVTFNYLASISITPTSATICSGNSTTLNANGADGTPSVATYILNPGGLTNNTDGVFSISPTINTSYTVSVNYGGCTKTANSNISVEGNIITILSPSSKTVCDFSSNVTITANTTINGAACGTCTYNWTTTDGHIVSGASTNAIQVDAVGTYTVSSSTANGCNSSTSPSSVVSLVTSTGSSTTCDVIYVEPNGSGTGLTKTSPTNLANAIENARCTRTVIKMKTGTYSFDNYMPLYDYTTIEGGYNSDYTIKSSDMTGGSNSTTILRNNTVDTGTYGSATKCSAFVAEPGAEGFRLQDIRIELPGSPSVSTHAASSGISNYGVRLGTGCSNYYIIRCYIDAGVGATP